MYFVVHEVKTEKSCKTNIEECRNMTTVRAYLKENDLDPKKVSVFEGKQIKENYYRV